jgi:pantothenate kinase
VAVVLALVLAQQVRQVQTQAQAAQRLLVAQMRPLIVVVAAAVAVHRIRQAATVVQVVSSYVGSRQTPQV